MTSAPLCFDPHHPWLAPLAGYSDLPFRLLCRQYGAAVACTEMISAKGLVYGSPGTKDLLATLPADSPLVVQLFGNEPAFMEQAMIPLLEQGYTTFDLNMGCSVPKVNRSGCGSAMLKDIPTALAVAKCMISLAGPANVGFKMRLGWDDNSHVWQDLALRLQDLGAGWITLHPRTARQGFGGTAHWDSLRTLAHTLNIPVLASGDLLCAEDGMRCLAQSGVASLMYARGAMQNPAIFQNHHALLRGESPPQPQSEALLHLIRRHVALCREHSTDRVALLKMRTFVPRYVHHVPGVRSLRQQLILCHSWEQLDDILEAFLTQTTARNF